MPEPSDDNNKIFARMGDAAFQVASQFVDLGQLIAQLHGSGAACLGGLGRGLFQLSGHCGGTLLHGGVDGGPVP